MPSMYRFHPLRYMWVKVIAHACYTMLPAMIRGIFNSFRVLVGVCSDQSVGALQPLSVSRLVAAAECMAVSLEGR